MKSEKDKLASKSVTALKAAAKRLGGKLVTPDGKAKTKQQLINTIVMKNRLAGKSMGGNTTTKKAAVKKPIAKKPASMLGEKPYNELPSIRTFDVIVLSATNTMGTRIKIVDTLTRQSKTLPKNNSQGAMQQAKDYLNKLGIKLFAKSVMSFLSKDFDTKLKP